MNSSLAAYQEFIDGLTHIRRSVEADWIRRKTWPKVRENQQVNKLISDLTPEQRSVMAEMIQSARDSGIHDFLASLNDEIRLRGLQLSRRNVILAIEPYGTELYWDWWSRCNGDPWPDHQLKEEYK